MPPKRSTVKCARCRRTFPRSHYGQHPTTPKYLDQLCRECRAHRDRKAIPNPADPLSESALIPLTKGQFAIVDADLAEYLSQWQWYAAETPQGFYAVRHEYTGTGRQKRPVWMHRAVIDAPHDVEVDHRDGDRLNNRRSNLRIATTAQNQANRGPSTTNTSGYRGVTWHKVHRKWQASIKRGGKFHFLGYFDTPTQAARAVDAKVLEVDGEFAWLNFPDD